MTVYQMLEKLLKSDLITLLLGIAACLATALCKRYLKNKKVRAVLPFGFGFVLAFLYGLIAGGAFTFLTPKRGIAVGTCATAVYVLYKRFFTGKNAQKTAVAITSAAAEAVKDVARGKEETAAVKDALLSLTERLEESVVISETHEISITEREERE